MSATSLSGGCLCGRVRYTLPSRPEGFHACHCGLCRKFTGGPMLAFEAPEGTTWEGTEHMRSFASSEWAERSFCDTCGSSLTWRLTAEGPSGGMTMIAAGTLDDMGDLALGTEIFIDRKPEGYDFSGERHRMTEAEVLAAFGATGAGEG